MIARKTSFVQRASKLKAWMFLETLMFNIQNQKEQSLTDLCNDLAINHGVSVQKQSLSERFNDSSKEFLKQLLEEALKCFTLQQDNGDTFKKFNKVRIKDSTSFQLPENMSDLYPGNGGNTSEATARIQFEYDLKTNKIEELALTPHIVNDYINAKETLNRIDENDLIIRDLGYISLDVLESIRERGAWFLNRIKPQTAIYEKKQGKYSPISIASIQKHLNKTGKPYLVKNVFIGWRRFMPCRIIFIKLPNDKIAERIKRQAAKTTRRCAKKISKSVLQNIDLNIFITNTTERQLKAHQLHDIYRLRWQIELIFKCWKSICNINQLKQANPRRIETMLYAQLLWILINWSIINLFIDFFYKLKGKYLSLYKSYKTLKTMKQLIRKNIRNL